MSFGLHLLTILRHTKSRILTNSIWKTYLTRFQLFFKFGIDFIKLWTVFKENWTKIVKNKRETYTAWNYETVTILWAISIHIITGLGEQ